MKNFDKVHNRVREYHQNPDDYRGHMKCVHGKWRVIVEKRLGYTAKQFAEWFQFVRPDAHVKISNINLSQYSGVNPIGGTAYRYGYEIEVTVDNDHFFFNSIDFLTFNFIDMLLEHYDITQA